MDELYETLRDSSEGEVRWARLVRNFVGASFGSAAADPTNTPLPSCLPICSEFARDACFAQDGMASDRSLGEVQCR